MRDAAGGNLLGSQNSGAQGTIVSGPVVQSFQGAIYTWYRVKWTTTPFDGWSIVNNLGVDVSVAAGIAHANTYNKTFSGANLVTAIAVAGAESKWNPNAIGDHGTSYGFWQIHAPPNNYDPDLLLSSLDYQAKAAREIFDNSISTRGAAFGWKPWTTWWPIDADRNYIAHQGGNGPYKSFLQTARVAAAAKDSTVITKTGDRVRITDSVLVRDSPAGNVIASGGTRLAGDTGTIVNGQTDASYLKYLASKDRYYLWWKIQWDSDNAVGWTEEDYLERVGAGPGAPTIVALAPSSLTLNQGGQFDVTYTIYSPSDRSVILGASLYPAGQSGGRLDNSSNDRKIPLSAGQNMVVRQFKVPQAASGVYDLVGGLWSDDNGNGVIDPNTDQELVEAKNPSAISINVAGSGCSYALSPTTLNLNTSGGALSGFGVFTEYSCNWTAQSNNDWIAVTANGSGGGSLEVNISVSANPTAVARMGTISVANQLFTVNQPANPNVPSGANQPVTVSGVFYSPPTVIAGRPFTFFANINSPIAQNALLGATMVQSDTTNSYYDSAHDVRVTIVTGTGQYTHDFTLPAAAPGGIYDVIIGIWADTNHNNVIDPGMDVLLGSITAYRDITVHPALGYVYTTLAPQDAVDIGGWRCDGGNWLSSGLQNFQTTVGSHTISFKPIPGYSTPSNRIISVQANGLTDLTAVYAKVPQTVDASFSYVNGFTISWKGTNGWTYSVERSIDPTFTNPTVLASGIPAEVASYTDAPASKAGDPFFYRVVIDP